MKYVLRKRNMVQETDSEDRKQELLSMGFLLERETGKPVADKAPAYAQTEIEYLTQENKKLQEQVLELRTEMDALKAGNRETAVPAGGGKTVEADTAGEEKENRTKSAKGK